MSNGVTEHGFIKKRLPEIRQEIIDDFKQKLKENNLPHNIETRPDSVIGLLIDVFAERHSSIWDVLEGVYYSMYPDTATGLSLDWAVQTVGMERLKPQKANGYVVFYGKGNIAKGTKIKDISTQDIWETAEEKTIDNSEFATCVLTIKTEKQGNYEITINNKKYTYLSADSNINNIISGIVSLFNSSDVSVSSDGASITVLYKSGNNAKLSISGNLEVSKIGVRVFCQSKEYINTKATKGRLSELVDFVDGIAQVNNLEDCFPGRKSESDSELSERHRNKKFSYSKSMIQSFEVALQYVVGVTEFRVFDNKSNVVDEFGRLPHSVHVVVDGGNNEQIAQTINKTIAAGIDTNGDISEEIETEQGKQLIKFDRPQIQQIHVKIKITKSNDQDDHFLVGTEKKISQAISKAGNSLKIGQDVVYQKLFREVFSFSGISNIDFKLCKQNGDFKAENIVILPTEKAKFHVSRIKIQVIE